MFSSLGQTFLLTSSVSSPPLLAAALLRLSMSTGSLRIQQWQLDTELRSNIFWILQRFVEIPNQKNITPWRVSVWCVYSQPVSLSCFFLSTYAWHCGSIMYFHMSEINRPKKIVFGSYAIKCQIKAAQFCVSFLCCVPTKFWWSSSDRSFWVS